MSQTVAETQSPVASSSVMARLLRRPLALTGLVIIAVVVLAALFAPWLAPYDPYEQFFEGLTIEGFRL